MGRTQEKGACICECLREQLASGATRGDETMDQHGLRSMCPCAAGGKHGASGQQMQKERDGI